MGEAETQGPFQLPTGILGFLLILKRSRASSTFEAFISAALLWCQMHVRPSVVIMQGPMTFSRVSTEDSDFPISCDIKDEPAFKSLQGNPVFFHVRASRCPFHLRQQIHVFSHIPIA